MAKVRGSEAGGSRGTTAARIWSGGFKSEISLQGSPWTCYVSESPNNILGDQIQLITRSREEERHRIAQVVHLQMMS